MSSPMGAVRSRVARLRPETRSSPGLAVVPPRVANARSGPFVLLVAAILVMGLVGLLLLNLSMQKGSFRLAALESEASHLQTREQSLDMKVDRLSSSDRLAGEARRMGMVPNRNPVFLDLSDGSVIGDPVAARPRSEPTTSTEPPTGDADQTGDTGGTGDTDGTDQTGGTGGTDQTAQQPTERR